MLPGGGNFLEAYLKEDRLWDRFESIVKSLYDSKFAEPLQGAEHALALPSATLPRERPLHASVGCTIG